MAPLILYATFASPDLPSNAVFGVLFFCIFVGVSLYKLNASGPVTLCFDRGADLVTATRKGFRQTLLLSAPLHDVSDLSDAGKFIRFRFVDGDDRLVPLPHKPGTVVAPLIATVTAWQGHAEAS